jgi:hypothetical protein
MYTLSNKFSHCSWRRFRLFQHDHALANLISPDFFQCKAGALSGGDEGDINPFSLNISDSHWNKVISIIRTLQIREASRIYTIHIVSPLWIVPELTIPAATAPVYGTENVSLIENSAGLSTEYCPWNGRILRNVRSKSIPAPVTFDTLKMGQKFAVVNLL